MKGYFIIVGILVAVVLSLMTLNVFFQRTLEMEMAEQFNRQQLLLAHAEASNMQDYLGGIRDDMRHIARLASLFEVRRETDFRSLTNVVFDDARAVKKRIQVLGGSGEVLFSRGSNAVDGPEEKNVLAGVRRSCPGDILIQQDTKRFSLVAPVCRHESFLGAVVLSLDIQDIAHSFLGPIKSGSRGYAWMMDEKGNLLYHPAQPDMVGRNLYKTESSCFRCHKTFDVEKKIIEGKSDYFGRYVAPTGEDKILAFSTASAGESRWIVAVSAPYSEVTMSTRSSMKFYSWIIILIFVLTSGIAAMLIVQYRKREKAEERARHEKELDMAHSEKLASLERLTSGIASEIGNPLTSVFSFVNVLMDMEEDEFKRETLETIYFHMNRIATILQQLSGYSKMPSAEFEPCRVNGLIEGSLSLIQYDKRVQDITIVRNLQPDLPEIVTDRGQLSQVIVTIILNAVDAMPDGGTLSIRSRVKDAGIAIDFEDTGVGMDREKLARIFDPLHAAKEKGTVPALAVSYHIISKLNGSLTVESEPGKGSRFVISLPLNGAQ
ncbi:MAG: cache domain-containing protein [Nitrospiraceae bacterium]|nr:cache domain-containing protein [Nitrospiraceae bacterium]